MKLTAEQWRRAEALFAQMLDLPPAGRAALLRQAADDPAVRREVAEMAAALDTAGDFLLQPVQVSSTEPVLESVPAGTRYGAWRILGPLGRGGMGEVYRAERADGAYQQQVALKILKRGLDTDSLLQRFLRERRILAQLTHPNIAHLIDAGATPEGRPYLVMEQVEGSPITDWCVEQRVPLPRMLALMCEVCDAVHAAHRRLVVHRDLKPSNVLVTADG
ncbi:MAG: serine/threonine-protein kinase, partial [Nevskiales bacterium]